MLKSNPENQADIRALADFLAALPVGEIATYDQLSQAIGRNVRNGAGYILTAARDAVEKESGAIFGTVHRVGVKRLTGQEAIGIGAQTGRKIRRAARRGIGRLGRIRDNSLTDADRKRINAYTAQLGAVALLAQTSTARKVEKQSTTATVLPVGRVLQVFSE